MSTEGPAPPRRPQPPAGRRTAGAPARRREPDGHPSFLAMIGVVAIVVATVIVVFFIFGYVLGRLFL